MKETWKIKDSWVSWNDYTVMRHTEYVHRQRFVWFVFLFFLHLFMVGLKKQLNLVYYFEIFPPDHQDMTDESGDHDHP